MNRSDESLKQAILSLPTPPLSPDFVHRTWQRVQSHGVSAQSQTEWAWVGAHVPRSTRSNHVGSWLLTLGVALTLAGWGAGHLWQSHADQELDRLDPVGMSSLLTL